MINTLFTKLASSSISIGTVVGSLIDMSATGIHPLNALALLAGSFASVCVGIYHLKRRK